MNWSKNVQSLTDYKKQCHGIYILIYKDHNLVLCVLYQEPLSIV